MYDNVGKLITHLSGIEPGCENFDLAVQFSISNFKYHTFLDVNCPRVKGMYNGLSAKFSIHAQYHKARMLDKCVKTFLESPLLLPKNIVVDPGSDDHFRLMHLLLELSENPTKHEYKESAMFAEQKEPDLSWLVELKEDATESCSSDNTLSDWSDDIEPEAASFEVDEGACSAQYYNGDEDRGSFADEIQGKSAVEIEIPERGILKPVGNTLMSEPVVYSASKAYWNEERSKAYWNEERGYWVLKESKNSADDEDLDVKLCVHGALWNDVKNIMLGMNETFPVRVISEFNLIRELIWMLQGSEKLVVVETNATSSIFKEGCFCMRKNGVNKYSVRPNVHIGHLSPGVLESILDNVCTFGNQISALKEFFQAILLKNIVAPWSSCTFQAFAVVVKDILNELRMHLSSLEKRAIENHCSVSLMKFKFLIRGHEKKVGFLAGAFAKWILPSFFADPSKYKASDGCIGLLNYLYSIAVESDYSEYLNGFCEYVFVHTCNPYLSMIDEWIKTGVVLDTYKEFFIARNSLVDVESPVFWSDGFLVKSSFVDQRCISTKEVVVPKFLQPISGHLFVAGKTCHVLSHLISKYSGNPLLNGVLDFDWISLSMGTVGKEKRNAYNSAELKAFSTWLSKIDKDELSFKENSERLCELNSLDREEMLTYFKKDVSVENCLSSHEGRLASIEVMSFSVFDFQERLRGAILEHSSKYSILFLDTIFKLCGVKKHFEILKKFYLMEAGDVMHEFCQSLFSKITANEFWKDSYMINVLFQEALTPFHVEDAEKVSLSLKENASGRGNVLVEIDSIFLDYDCTWPVNIFVSPYTIDCYSRVFSFLMKLKFVKYVLEMVYMEQKVFNSDGMMDEIDPLSQHRIYMLRTNLLHFVNNLYSYMMGRIVLSGAKEFEAEVEKACSVDDLINAHCKFVTHCVERCLLTKSTNVIMNGIMKVLELGLEFSRCYNVLKCSKITAERKEAFAKFEKISSEYGRCRRFLVSLLHNVVKRRSTDHLAYLAMSLGVS
eukprot:Nk52_evm129s226 gene=Nk52_evmTU129s226